MSKKWMSKVRELPWWFWPVLIAYLAVLAVDSASVHFAGTPDWRQHLGLSRVASTLTGVEIFIGLPLLFLARRRHQAGVAARRISGAEPGVSRDDDLPGRQP